MSNPPPPPAPPPPATFPPEVHKWNWGAFLLSWVWAIRHRVWVGLWALVPIPALWIGMSIALGVKGSRWAWQKQPDADLERFQQSQKRWAIAGATFWLIVIPLAIWGVIASTSGTDTVSSRDGRISVTVPGSWSPDDDLHASAEVAASNRFEEVYVIVLSEDASALPDGTTLDAYSEVARGALVEGAPSAEQERLAEFSIDGHDALEYEIRGTSEGLDVVWLHTTIRTNDAFVQIVAWTMESQYGANAETLQDVIRSFRYD